MWFELIIASFVVIIGLIYKRITKYKNYWKDQGVPEHDSGPFKTMLKRKHIIDGDGEMYEKFKDEKFVGIQELGQASLYIKDLDVLKNIFVKDFDYFPNRGFKAADSDLSGEMLSMMDGQKWKELRVLLTPIFTTSKIRRVFKIFDHCGGEFVDYLKSQSNDGKAPVEIRDALGRYTMSVICAAVFGIDCNAFTDSDPQFISNMKHFMQFPIIKLIRVITISLLPKVANFLNLRFNDAKYDDYFEKIIVDIIRQREGLNEKKDDFLQLLLEHRAGKIEERVDEEMDQFEKEAKIKTMPTKSKKEMTERSIIAQCILFIFGGYDTNDSLLSFASFLLAMNQDVQEKLYQEIKTTYEENNGKIDHDILARMEYLDMVVNETLRMYSPAGQSGRQCVKDYTIEKYGIEIKKDMRVLVPVHSIHNDPKYWKNPEEFNPERFSKEEKEKRHPYAFLAFGHGPRNCIGRRFALIESKTAILHLISNFELHPCEKTQIPLKISTKTSFTKPESGIWLELKKRNEIK